ncbi:MAG: peptidoglycan DD-metalloendopeptidase family protein [Bacteroidales bacterium]|jgi:murein DD-endopeptidase MepM/ murein hydrolase activator NlpD|nr:peptidoglycan DD-metalloendopeptidase family protein [Bacteroidales bacterium]MDD3273765.1 peptidoglycan DD-metalloendopeptidase family protein [Bacteroidales bacterium]
MKYLRLFFFLFLIVACKNRQGENYPEGGNLDTLQVVTEFGIPVDEFEIKEGAVKRGQFFTNLMTDLGAEYADIYSLTQASRGQFDLRKMKIGNNYKAYYTLDEDPKLAYLVYQDTKTSFVTFGIHDSIFVKVHELDVTVRTRVGEAIINTSLWNDCVNSGMSPLIANRLSDIYAWTIDFFGLQRGDSFMVVYDEILAGGEFLDIGTIHAAYFRHNGVMYEAHRFIQDESPNYWNEKGENLRKAFLKAPLKFSRVSSGFSYARRHPVTRVVRPHTGVDYAAPTGTPVVSIGDGVVTQRAYAGGGGNTVKIKHNSTYTSAYLHLSRYASGLRVGKRVRQGEVIGYVGSTGLSTGPHLDFRIWRNGKPINPLKMDAPPADPIKSGNREAFNLQVLKSREISDSVRSVQFLDSLVIKLGAGKSKV